jgi:ABC-type lipoprotein export system ATPase subunit
MYAKPDGFGLGKFQTEYFPGANLDPGAADDVYSFLAEMKREGNYTCVLYKHETQIGRLLITEWKTSDGRSASYREEHV